MKIRALLALLTGAWLAFPAYAQVSAPVAPQVTALSNIQGMFTEQVAAGTGLEARYLLQDGAGATTLADASGNNCTASLPSSSSPTWGTDGSLNFAGTNTGITLPACVTAMTQTFEFVFSGAVEAATPGTGTLPSGSTNIFMGTTVANNGLNLRAATTFSGGYSGGAFGQGYGTKWIDIAQNNGSNIQGYAGAGLDNALHTLIMVYNRSGAKVTTYLDGVAMPIASSQPTPLLTVPTSGVTYVIGQSSGGSLGYYRLYGAAFSTTAYTAAQVAQDSNAFMALTAHDGAVASPYYGPVGTNVEIVTRGESLSFGHNTSNSNSYLGSPGTPANFTNDAIGYLNTAFPSVAYSGFADGNDSATGWLLAQTCPRMLRAMSQSGGVKVIVFHDHGNSQAVAYGTFGGPGVLAVGAVGPNDTTVTLATFDEMDIEGQCAQGAKSSGWLSVKADSISSGTSSGNNNSALKDVDNPIMREFWVGHYDTFWDEANDTRVGGDASSGTGSDCVLDAGGSATGMFQSDNLHFTICGHQFAGHELAAVYADMIQALNPVAETVAATYQMGLGDLDAYIRVPGGGTLTLMPTAGLHPNVRIATITNYGSTPETITAGTNYNGGAQNTISSELSASATTYSLAAGATKAFRVAFPVNGDATGGPAYVLVANQ